MGDKSSSRLRFQERGLAVADTLDVEIETVEIAVFGYEPGYAVLSANGNDLGIKNEISCRAYLPDSLLEQCWMIGPRVQHGRTRESKGLS